MTSKAVQESRGKCRTCGGPKPLRPGVRVCDGCKTSRHDPAVVAKRKLEREKAAAAPEGSKWCARCDTCLPIAQFGVRSTGKPMAYCFPCQKSYLHEMTIMRNYGITAEEYQALLALQGGRCAVCRVRPRTRKLAVDHDHKTGQVRGLLCLRCNHKVIGAAREDPMVLRRAAGYLEAPPAETRTLAHLGTSAALEAEDALEEAERKASGLPIAVYRPNGVGPHPEKFIAMIRLADLVPLLLAAGYGGYVQGPDRTQEAINAAGARLCRDVLAAATKEKP